MSSTGRAQVSLLFYDADLYSNFVEPLKDDKELSPLIMKLLSAYYRNSKVRDLVEGVEEGESYEDEYKESYNEALTNAQNTLSMYSALYGELRNTLEDGTDEMMNIINGVAESSGGEASKQTDFGISLPKLIMKNQTTEPQNAHPENSANNNELSKQVEELTSDVKTLKESIIDNKETLNSILTLIQGGVVKVESKQENQSTLNESQSVQSVESVTQVSEEVIETTDSKTQDVQVAEPDKVDSLQPKEDDVAKKALSSLVLTAGFMG